MSITLYFAKLNLISEELFRLYENPEERKKIAAALLESLRSGKCWKKESYFTDDSGTLHKTAIEYSVHVVQYNPSEGCAEGWIYKKNKLYYKTLDSSTNTLVQQSTKNTDGNRFVIDLNHGFVGYNTSNRFGYREFIEAFREIVNLGEAAKEYSFRYNMSLCVSGINLEEIKRELRDVGRIRELRIRMQPPNPSDELLDELQKRCDGLVKDFKDANVTGLELLYSTNGALGIDLDAPLISERINDIQGLYSGLPVEESTKKGYVSVEGTNVSGGKFSSGDAKPIKRIVEDIGDIVSACLDAFQHLL